MWSVSSLEDIQFLMNTAAVEDVNVNTALQGLATNNEKDKQVEGAGSGDFKAQSFPSGKEFSPDDVLFTNKDNDCASIGLANLSVSTAKDFTDVDEGQILKEAKHSEEANVMEECQGRDSCGELFGYHTTEKVLMSGN